MFSLCMLGFSPGYPTSSTSPKRFKLGVSLTGPSKLPVGLNVPKDAEMGVAGWAFVEFVAWSATNSTWVVQVQPMYNQHG